MSKRRSEPVIRMGDLCALDRRTGMYVRPIRRPRKDTIVVGRALRDSKVLYTRHHIVDVMVASLLPSDFNDLVRTFWARKR